MSAAAAIGTTETAPIGSSPTTMSGDVRGPSSPVSTSTSSPFTSPRPPPASSLASQAGIASPTSAEGAAAIVGKVQRLTLGVTITVTPSRFDMAPSSGTHTFAVSGGVTIFAALLSALFVLG